MTLCNRNTSIVFGPPCNNCLPWQSGTWMATSTPLSTGQIMSCMTPFGKFHTDFISFTTPKDLQEDKAFTTAYRSTNKRNAGAHIVWQRLTEAQGQRIAFVHSTYHFAARSYNCSNVISTRMPKSLTRSLIWGHEATDTGLAYAPVSQAHGHHHTVQCFALLHCSADQFCTTPGGC